MNHNQPTLSPLSVLRPLSAVNYWISKAAMNLAGGLLGAMVMMILAQVFYRYVLNDSLSWTEEMAKFSMVWIAFLVAPWVYRENLNVSIQMFAEAFPKVMQLFGDLFITSLILLICVIFLTESVEFWLGGLTISASSVPIKLAVFYSCAPFSFAMLTLLGIERFIQQSYDMYAYYFVKRKLVKKKARQKSTSNES